MALWKVVLWIAGLVAADHYLGGWARRTINTALPATVLGVYPQSSGWLNLVDVVFGLALVAYSESFSADARVTCSKPTWGTAISWFWSRRCCSVLIIGGRLRSQEEEH